MTWKPNYRMTDAIGKALLEIGRAQGAVEAHSWSPVIEEEIRFKARIRATHYSTRIEGNRLALGEAEQVVRRQGVTFAGRERDAAEVERYWKALAQVQEWAEAGVRITDGLIRKLHAMVDKGARRKPTPYREKQNSVTDAATRKIVYMPPEAHDVPGLMADMIEWIRDAERMGIAAPIIAALAHYQFVTIHPFLDGNGRTARLLATLILHKGGYGLRGFFSLEEYHARDLPEYYRQLATHPDHNYYDGRAEADLTAWVEYFTGGVAHVFKTAAAEAIGLSEEAPTVEPEALRGLSTRARRALALFADRDEIRSADIADLFSISPRAARMLIEEWVNEGFLVVANPSNRGRSYGLAEVYRQYIGSLSEVVPRPWERKRGAAVRRGR